MEVMVSRVNTTPKLTESRTSNTYNILHANHASIQRYI